MHGAFSFSVGQECPLLGKPHCEDVLGIDQGGNASVRDVSGYNDSVVEIVGLERGSGPEALTCSVASVVSRPAGLRSRIALSPIIGNHLGAFPV